MKGATLSAGLLQVDEEGATREPRTDLFIIGLIGRI
jgi:hypothetical protein